MKHRTATALPLIFASLATLLPAFDNSPGWKKDEDGNYVFKDGNPVYVDSAGQEKTVDVGTIRRLNAEAQTNREQLEEARADLKRFEGIDPVKAREALDRKDPDPKTKEADEAEIQRRIDEAVKTERAKTEEAQNRSKELEGKLNNTVLDNAFRNSTYISENIVVPAEMFRNTFGEKFKVIDGVPVPVDAEGKRLISPSRAGEWATFDEGVEVMVNNYEHKDSILKAQERKGSGSKGGDDVPPVKGETMPRSEYESLSAQEMGEASARVQKGELTLT